MNLKEQINEEIKKAMKAKDKTRLNVVRYLKKLFIENDTSNKPVLVEDIVISYAKKTKDSLALYPESSDQYSEILAEIKVLEEFLPKPISEQEVQSFIDTIKDGQEKANMGSIMKELTPKIKGKFDGKKASQMVMASLK